VTLSGAGRLTADVYGQIKQAILDGRLRPGDALPATRHLARQLAVSRNTVLNAYQMLTAEGFLVGRVGAGTFVDAGAAPHARRAARKAALHPRASWPRFDEARRPGAAYDFRIGSPDPALFPWRAWRALVAGQLRGRQLHRGYPPPEGEPALRAAIARHVGLARSVQADPDDVIITSGAQQAFDLIGRVLVEPGDITAVEDPGYPPARHAMEVLGARVEPVRVDAEGLVVDAIPAGARLVHVTPSHQFPLGNAMSLSRRMALLAWSERHGAAIVEDDYDSEFRFDGRPLEPLQSLDKGGRVLYVGTFSKVLLPTLRVGFIVAPSSLVPGLRAAKLFADSHGPLDTQRALAEFIDRGLLARHIRRMARVYHDRREALLGALDRHLGDRVAAVPSAAGLHTTVHFRDRAVSAEDLAHRALEAGVAVQPLRPYYRRRHRAGLALGYGLITAARIDEGIRRLAGALGTAR